MARKVCADQISFRRRAVCLFIYLFRNSQLSTLYSTVKSRTEMTIITTVRYQGSALTDTFNAKTGYSA